MYNSTTREFTLQDSSGSYSWIFENMENSLSDQEIYDWIDFQIEIAKEQDILEIEERAEKLTYPRYGVSNADRIDDSDDYIDYWTMSINEDYENEREFVFKMIKSHLEEKATIKNYQELIEKSTSGRPTRAKLEKLVSLYKETINLECRLFKGVDSRGDYGWYVTRFGQTSFFLGKNLEIAIETCSDSLIYKLGL